MRLTFLLMRLPLVALLITISATAGEPFGVQVQDENTGRGVPMVTLETVNGIRFITDSAGWIAFDEPGLMGHRVHFKVSTPGYTFPKDNFGVAGVAFDAKPGATADIKLVRTNIAERLYRITGQGIYRDSTLLGKESPLPLPNLAGGVLGQSDAQAAMYQGKLFWLWSGSQRASHPLGNARGAGATSDLPINGGLDPTQGIHFNYFTDDRGDAIPMLPNKEPGSLRMEGLLSVKDKAGAEHLVAHYILLDPQGKMLEHGLAELGALHEFERLTVLGADYTWQFPQGQAVRVTDEKDKVERFYFVSPFGHVRAPVNYEALLTPSSYEALAWDDDKGEVRWQQLQPPMTREDEDRYIAKKMIKEKEERLQLSDAVSHKELIPRSSSIRWNAFRKAWLMLFSSEDGSAWLAQSASVEGPWHRAVLIAAHDGHTLTAMNHLDAFDQEGGRIIYFQGTIGATGVDTPRYDLNALMYRVDLSDPRFK